MRLVAPAACLCAALSACSSPAGPAVVAPGGPAPGAAPGGPGPRPAAADPAPPALRLPGDVRPTRYALDLTLVPDTERATGTIAIAAEVVRPTRVVWLNATELAIERATLGGAAARVIPGGEDFVGLVAPAELAPGPLAIEVGFTAPIDRTKSRGLYAEREGSDWYAYTFFEPIDARRAFPCFDEPSYKVPWQLTFHVKQDHVALANAAVARETPEPNGMKRVELELSKPLPSYLVAFVVGPFELVDGGTAGRIQTPVRFIIPKGRGAELRYAKQVTPRVVAALEDYFDMAYPYGKLDVAVVPRFWGTMEHPGIVAMGQPLTLIRPEQETRARRQAYTNILAHELAHYWFGDLVTMAWWDDTWLNESFGSWMDSIITDAVEPGFRFRDNRVWTSIAAMSSDETLSTQSVRQPVTTKAAIGASFDGEITYSKGASVARMFEGYAGAESWRDMIRAYMRAFAWRNATADDLFRMIAKHHGPSIEQGLRSFLEQPGVPRISATLQCTPGQAPRLLISQRRALPAGTVDNTARRWTVPVCVRYGARHAQRACLLLDDERGELMLNGDEAGAPDPAPRPVRDPRLPPTPPVLLPPTPRNPVPAGCPTWFVLNAGATGYYRSVVDLGVAKQLLTPGSAIARAAKPTAAEKMMMIADLRAMVDRDELPLDKLFELAPLIANDPDERVALWAFNAASFRSDALDDALYEKGRRFALRTFGPAARRLGWARAKGDSDERHELRTAFVPAVAFWEPALAAQAAQLADRWLADRTGIEDDLAAAALTTAAGRGDRARFDRMLAAAKTARDRAEKQRILAALGGFRDPELARAALELVRGTEHDLRDTLGILWGILFRRETRAIGMAFVTAHIDGLLARMRDDEAGWFFERLAAGFCTVAERAAIEALIVPRAPRHGAQAVVTRGLELAQQCIANSQRQLPALRRVLERY